MPDVRSVLSKHAFNASLAQILVFIYLLFALAMYLLVPVLGIGWMNLPFIGAFVEQTMVFNGSGSTDSPSQWPAHQQGLIFGYQLRAVDSTPVYSARDLRSALSTHAVGDPVTLKVITPEGEEKDYLISLISMPLIDRYAYLYVPYLIGLAFLIAAAWIFIIRRRMGSGLAFSIFSTSAALGVGTLFDLYTTHQLNAIWSLALPMTAGSFIHFVLTYPREPSLIQRRPWLVGIPYAIALGFGVLSITQLNNLEAPTYYALAWRASYAFVGLSILLGVSWLAAKYFSIPSPVEKEQLRISMLGTLLAIGPMAVWFIGAPMWTVYFPFSPWLLLPLVIFPAATGYSLQHFRLEKSDFLLSRAAVYALVTVLVAVGYALLVAGLTLLFNALVVPDSPLVTGMVIVLLALLIQPLRRRMESSVARVFLRGEDMYDDRLRAFNREISGAGDMRSVVQILRRTVQETILPSMLHVYTYDPISEMYVAVADSNKVTSSDLRFTVTSALAQLLNRQHEPVFLDDDSVAGALQNDLPRIQMLGAQVLVPLPGRQRLSGWLALGPIATGEPYNMHEINFLSALCEQGALAIERAQTLANMENRVRGLNVLAKVAQGANVTLTLDDIFELIYAQTTQVISASEFQISLVDTFTNQLTVAFFVKDEERLNHLEKLPLVGGALEYDVYKQRRTILTDDFTRECQRRGILSTRSDLLAWMCVPLNSGAETIGTLTLANREASVVYTQEHQNLMEAVADQVAGAIVKARLLQESERRTRQLAGLNEVTRQLSTTLEVEPLLHNVLQSAMEIIHCEAGNLLLFDEQTGELIVRSSRGPAAEAVNIRRISADDGLLWRAMREQQPVTQENPRPAPDWSMEGELPVVFTKHSVLVLPLMLQDRANGVLELVNKRDGVRFLPDDVDLLSAFAAQAAVALENARLYTNTDQALAERVEELSVMQRIDRELNASLDTQRAMNITLEWALRQTGAMAGLVGRIEEGGVVVVASQGYSGELDLFTDGLLPGSAVNLTEAMESGLVRIQLLDSAHPGLLNGATAQVAVPIRRESDMIGLLLLESSTMDAVSEDKVNFLQRLSDHAAIAISNAQLYAAIQAANVAKSEFVSFVSHELKNPMTSIKGYTELLAAGAVGGINEGQASFLTTIRANIDRMNTLVSDLNDMSKIEAGRLRLDYRTIRLMDVVEETVRSTRKQIEDKNQILEIKISENLPLLWADRTRVSQVLVNLVSNAHKYTESGGKIYLEAEKSQNQWDEKGARDVVHIWVTDTGIGISLEDQKKIFQKFFRSEDPKTREAPGTGLGLNITRSLVEMQGGRIWFESEFRKGTTFHFTVPVAEQA